MKTLVYIPLCVLAAIFLVSCDPSGKDNGGKDTYIEASSFTISAQSIEDLPAAADEIKAVISYYAADNKEVKDIIASASITDRGFSIELPGRMNSKYLHADEFGDMPQEVLVSDRDVRICGVLLEVYGSGTLLGQLYSYAYEYTYVKHEINYMFTDRDFTITGGYIYENGEYSYPVNFNMSASKGWNAHVVSESEVGISHTNIMPLNPIWRFREDGTSGETYIEASPLTISAQEVEGMPIIADEVRATVSYDDTDGSEAKDIIASAPISEGGFSIELPGRMKSKYLFDDNFYDLPQEVLVSDRNARICDVLLEVYGSGTLLGQLYSYAYDTYTYQEIDYMFADRDFTIAGGYTYEDEGEYVTVNFNVSANKGWNVFVMSESMDGSISFTSVMPQNSIWEFIGD